MIFVNSLAPQAGIHQSLNNYALFIMVWQQKIWITGEEGLKTREGIIISKKKNTVLQYVCVYAYITGCNARDMFHICLIEQQHVAKVK